MSNPPSLVRSVFSNWGTLAVGLVLSFVLAPVVVRSLGDTWYGVWGITMQFSGYLWLLDLGIRESVVRYVARHEARRDQDTLNAKVSVAIYLYLVIALATMLVGLAAATWGVRLINIDPALVPTARIVVLLTAFNMSLTWLANPFVGILIGLQRYDLMNMSGVAVNIARFTGTLLLMRAGYGIIALAGLHVAASVASGLAVYAICRRLMPQFRITSLARCRGEFSEVWRFSFFVVLNNTASKIIFATDSFIIGSHLPVAAVTYFSIPSSLLQHLTNAMRSMSQVLYPRTSSLEGADDHQGLRALFLNGCKYATLVGLPIGSVYLTIGSDFIRLWMGPRYAEESNAVLLLLTGAYMMTFPHYTVYYVLLGLGRQRGVAYLRLAEAAMNLVLSLILVRTMGIAGVALGTAIPHVLSMMVVLPVISARQVGVSIGEYLTTVVVRPFAAAVPAIGLGLFLHTAHPAPNMFVFALQAALIVATFVVAALAVAFSAAERDQLWGRLRAWKVA